MQQSRRFAVFLKHPDIDSRLFTPADQRDAIGAVHKLEGLGQNREAKKK